MVAAYEQPVELWPAAPIAAVSIRSSAVYTREDFGEVIGAMACSMYRIDGGWVETTGFDGVEDALHDLRAGKGMKIVVETP